MKKNLPGIILFSLLILFGCGTTQKRYYHSTADSIYYSRSVLTDAKLIKWPEVAKYPFGLVVATDLNSSDKNPYNYAFFAPSVSSGSVNEISNLRIEYAVQINKKDLEYFAIEVDKLLRKWSSKSSSTEATYYEFYSFPEKETSLENEKDGWYPLVKFNFQNTSKGLISELDIGPDSFRFKYKFDEMTELAAFQWVLSEAVSELRAREKE